MTARSAAIGLLEAYQRAFSTVLRTPLDRRTGTMRAAPGAYPDDLVVRVRAVGVAPAERLAVYNRQYWFRLFTVLQNEHRLTTALVGAWTFNELAERFLLERPPRGHELATIGDDLDTFLAATLPAPGIAIRGPGRGEVTIPREAIVEGCAIDRAFHAAMTAPPEPALRLTLAEPERLFRARLVWSRSLTLVEESWPLVTLRHGLPTPLGDHRAALPARHDGGPRTWVIHRNRDGLRAAPLPAPQAELLRALREQPIGGALAWLEERRGAAIAANVERWFAEGIEQGYWTGLTEAGSP